jgi:alpha-galactosidase
MKRPLLLFAFLLLARSSALADDGNAFMQRIQSAHARVVLSDGSNPDTAGLKLTQSWQGNILRSKLKNTGKQPVRVKKVLLFSGEHGLPGETPFYGEGFQMLSQNGGTLAHPLDFGDYTDRAHYKIPEPPGFRSIYELLLLQPANEPCLLLGFTSCRRFVGRFDLAADRMQIVQDTENLQLLPGQSWQLEDLLLTCGPSPDPLYAQLAQAIEKNHHRLHFKPEPTGWCSWYCYGARVTAQDIRTNLDFIAAHLPQLKYIQIDDGYQPAMGDWLEPGKSLGGNVRDVIRQIAQRGFAPAIWVAPFIASPDSKLFHDHPDWFIQDDSGAPLPSNKVSFGGWHGGPWYCLDGTHPGAQKYLENVFRVMRREWGCTYFKLDANMWGAMHGGHFHDPAATRVEAYRRGMAAVRRGAGDAFLLGCNHPLWPSLGLIHGSRSSLDIGRSWETFANTGRENLRRNWQNGRLWWNDPDCVLLTGDLPENEFLFHATLIYATGGMLLSGDDLTTISPGHLDLLRKLIPPTGIPAQFENQQFETGRIPLPGREMIALFNWSNQSATRTLHLSAKSQIKDFWTGATLGEHTGEFTLPDLPPHSARLLEVTRPPK